jgi:hypothetical protein
LNAGVSTRVISDVIGSDSAVGICFDAGIIIDKLVDNLSIGIAGINLGPVFAGSPLPALIKTGAAYEFAIAADQRILLAADYSFALYGTGEVNTGIEYTIFKVLSIRGGYTFGERAFKMSLGGGVKAEMNGILVGIDYAYSTSDEFGGTHRAGLTVEFNSKK